MRGDYSKDGSYPPETGKTCPACGEYQNGEMLNLRAENRRLRDALAVIVSLYSNTARSKMKEETLIAVARAALDGTASNDDLEAALADESAE